VNLHRRPHNLASLDALGAWAVQGLSGFRVQGLGFGCRVQGSGFRIEDLGFRVQGSGSRVEG